MLQNITDRIQKAEQQGYTGIVIDCTQVTDAEILALKFKFEVKEMADDDTHYYIISNHALKLN